jgi:hypothetical protein
VPAITAEVEKETRIAVGGARTAWTSSSRTMFSLRLSWAWTIYKGQGQTMTGCIVLILGNKEREAGLTYTAFSRATNVNNIGLPEGVTFERLTSIGKMEKVRLRIKEEERLQILSAETEAAYLAEHPNRLEGEEEQKQNT